MLSQIQTEKLRGIVALGKERGYVTRAEIYVLFDVEFDVLFDAEFDAEQLAGLFSTFEDMGIAIQGELPNKPRPA